MDVSCFGGGGGGMHSLSPGFSHKTESSQDRKPPPVYLRCVKGFPGFFTGFSAVLFLVLLPLRRVRRDSETPP